jgi:hypothetical protein
MPVSKKSATCELCHNLTPSINFSLFLKCCDPNQFLQVGKEVVVSRSGISPVRTTPIWNAPAVLECEQLYADMHRHGGALHHMSAFHTFCSEWPYTVFLTVSQVIRLTLLCSHAAWIPPSAPLSCPRKQLPSAFWQMSVKTILTCWWMCMQSLLWLVFGFNIHK